MAVIGDFCQIKVLGSAFNQSIINTFDYKIGGSENPGSVFLDIFAQEWRRWICNLLSTAYQVAAYTYQVYERTEYVPAVTNPKPAPAKIKLWFIDKTRLDGGSADAGRQNANPLPTFVGASARKTCTGEVALFRSRDHIAAGIPDTRIRGSSRFGPLTEDQTKNDQGNEFADTLLASVNPQNVFNPFATNRANWLSGWRHACEQLREITTQATLGGTTSTMKLQVVSLRGPKGVIRTQTVDGVVYPVIFFSPVSSFGVSRYVGKQGSRQQREKFQ